MRKIIFILLISICLISIVEAEDIYLTQMQLDQTNFLDYNAFPDGVFLTNVGYANVVFENGAPIVIIDIGYYSLEKIDSTNYKVTKTTTVLKYEKSDFFTCSYKQNDTIISNCFNQYIAPDFANQYASIEFWHRRQLETLKTQHKPILPRTAMNYLHDLCIQAGLCK